jgi:WD40 repeat protein
MLWRLARHSPPSSGVHSLCFDPSGRELISGGEDDAVICWDLKTGRRKWTRQFERYLRHVAMSQDGKVLAVAVERRGAALFPRSSTGAVRWISTEGPAARVLFVLNQRSLMAVTFGPADSIWDVQRLVLTKALPGHPKYPYVAAASADGTIVATGDEQAGITIWSAVDWVVLARRAYTPLLTIAPNGSWLATDDPPKGFSIWHLPSVKKAGQ